MDICSIVLTLGLLLFFYYGFFIIKLAWQKLYIFKPTHEITEIFHETGTQTDLFLEETESQDGSRDEYSCSSDEIDGTNEEQELAHEVGQQCPNVKKSLQQVFECAYSQFIQTWYTVPESRDSQPLYDALGREFDMLVDRIIGRASDIKISSIAVDSVRILAQHLRNAKQSDRGPLFSSWADEIAVLRVFSEALVRNFFPESLTTQSLTRCALNEIVTLKAEVCWLQELELVEDVWRGEAQDLLTQIAQLQEENKALLNNPSLKDSPMTEEDLQANDLLVRWLSTPDNLNQFLVSHLDAVTLTCPMNELQALQREDTPSSLDSEDKEVIIGGTEDAPANDVKPKKRGVRKLLWNSMKFKESISKLKFGRKRKKKRKEENVIQTPHPDFMRCRASCPQDSSSYDSDLEDCPIALQEEMIEFQLSYEVWRLSCWVVSVQSVQEQNGELSFTISLEEGNNPEKLHWDVSKSQTDIRQFYSSLQDCANLPSIAEFVESTEKAISDKFKEQARAALETFLQDLLKDGQLGQSPEVFQFLCPLERLLTEVEPNGGVWSLLTNLAHILSPVHGEEDDDELGPAEFDATDGLEPEGLTETEDEEADLKGSRDALCQITSNPGGFLPVDSGDGTSGDGEEPGFQAACLTVTDGSEDDPLVREPHSKWEDGGQQNDTIDGLCFPFPKARAQKKDKPFPKPAGLRRRRGKGPVNVGTAEEPRAQGPNKGDVNQPGKEQHDCTKAIIDLIKEISGLS